MTRRRPVQSSVLGRVGAMTREGWETMVEMRTMWEWPPKFVNLQSSPGYCHSYRYRPTLYTRVSYSVSV